MAWQRSPHGMPRGLSRQQAGPPAARVSPPPSLLSATAPAAAPPGLPPRPGGARTAPAATATARPSQGTAGSSAAASATPATTGPSSTAGRSAAAPAPPRGPCSSALPGRARLAPSGGRPPRRRRLRPPILRYPWRAALAPARPWPTRRGAAHAGAAGAAGGPAPRPRSAPRRPASRPGLRNWETAPPRAAHSSAAGRGGWVGGRGGGRLVGAWQGVQRAGIQCASMHGGAARLARVARSREREQPLVVPARHPPHSTCRCSLRRPSSLPRAARDCAHCRVVSTLSDRTCAHVVAHRRQDGRQGPRPAAAVVVVDPGRRRPRHGLFAMDGQHTPGACRHACRKAGTEPARCCTELRAPSYLPTASKQGSQPASAERTGRGQARGCHTIAHTRTNTRVLGRDGPRPIRAQHRTKRHGYNQPAPALHCPLPPNPLPTCSVPARPRRWCSCASGTAASSCSVTRRGNAAPTSRSRVTTCSGGCLSAEVVLAAGGGCGCGNGG